jgi:hypothetical protein
MLTLKGVGRNRRPFCQRGKFSQSPRHRAAFARPLVAFDLLDAVAASHGGHCLAKSEEPPHLIFDPLSPGLGLQIDGDDAIGDAPQGGMVRPSGTTSTSGFSIKVQWAGPQRMRLECGVGFHQLRTYRRTRSGQLWATTGDIRETEKAAN